VLSRTAAHRLGAEGGCEILNNLSRTTGGVCSWERVTNSRPKGKACYGMFQGVRNFLAK
jgi:hypothetical protein